PPPPRAPWTTVARYEAARTKTGWMRRRSLNGDFPAFTVGSPDRAVRRHARRRHPPALPDGAAGGRWAHRAPDRTPRPAQRGGRVAGSPPPPPPGAPRGPPPPPPRAPRGRGPRAGRPSCGG